MNNTHDLKEVAALIQDHHVREFVNTLRDIGFKYGQTSQLRCRISDVVLPFVKRYTDANGYLQAKIDELMLEYCPAEMTPDQLRTWGNSQRPVSDIEKAFGLQPGELTRSE